MNIRNINILSTFAALLLCVVVGSCSQGELDVDQGRTLPPGKYPLMFTATVDGMMSRADVETEPWIEDDKIAAQIVGYPFFVGYYVLNTDGSVKESDEPLAWPVDKGIVRAWYPGEKLPITKEIGNQSAEGYHGIDFLYAESEGEKSYKETVPLVFKHQMAKVTCKLSPGEGVTEDDLKTAKVFYYGYPKASFSVDEKDGKLKLKGNGDNEWIESTSDYEALLVPQDMSGQHFIKVNLTITVNGVPIKKELIFTPEQGKGELEAGSAYTYNITVQKDRLEVKLITAAWNDKEGEGAKADVSRINLPKSPDLPDDLRKSLKFSRNVTPMPSEDDPEYLLVQGFVFTISYEAKLGNQINGFLLPDQTDLSPDETPHKMIRTEDGGDYEFEFKLAHQVQEGITLDYGEYAQVGDFYYEDGTWGRYHPNAWSEENNPDGVKIIGIVFKTGFDGTDDKLDNYRDEDWETKPKNIRGYVVALNDASNANGVWLDQDNCKDPTDPRNQRYRAFGPIYTLSGASNSHYSGYITTNIIRNQEPGKAIYEDTKVEDTKKGFWAFKVACEYGPAAPSNSSGWYLPSVKQWNDLINVNGLRLYFEEAEGTYFRLETGAEYWTSIEYGGNNAWKYRYVIGKISNEKKWLYYYVRSVLTF